MRKIKWIIYKGTACRLSLNPEHMAHVEHFVKMHDVARMITKTPEHRLETIVSDRFFFKYYYEVFLISIFKKMKAQPSHSLAVSKLWGLFHKEGHPEFEKHFDTEIITLANKFCPHKKKNAV